MPSFSLHKNKRKAIPLDLHLLVKKQSEEDVVLIGVHPD
jgi:hypothetical protein